MLILTRRTGETLMVGDEVSLTVLGVTGNQVRIGVNAPKEVQIHREEIYHRIKNGSSQKSNNRTQRASSEEIIDSFATGIVTNYDKHKKYGHIYVDKLGEDAFFHISEVANKAGRTVDVELSVSFTLFRNEKGYIARNVKIDKYA